MFVYNHTELPKFDKDIPLFLDTETEGLYGAVRLVQLYQPLTSEPVIIDRVTYEDNFEKLKLFLQDFWLVCHNATYDMTVLGIVPRELDDTMLLARQTFLN